MSIVLPSIPEYITVHLGPPNSNAKNVTVSFVDYIKNVASSEIYPTWNESAIIANIYAQISFVLNRIYLEYYPSRGYNFNITNTTALDQSFQEGRNIFENISKLVDTLFNDYIRRQGYIEPLAAKYCNGTTSTCDGLSQWGSEELAKEGKNSVEILKYYYGDNIELVQNAIVKGVRSSYPGTPLRIGSTGYNVKIIQVSLNRISQNYPLIPKINPVDGVFGKGTENAVKVFQGIFNLTKDGIVGKATWYKILLLYVGVTGLGELESEGVKIFGRSFEYPDAISLGDKGEKVTILQYFLSILAEFYETIPFLKITGVFGEKTRNAVISFQQSNGLPQTGIVDAITWNAIYEQYIGIIDTVITKNADSVIPADPYPGEVLKQGSKGENVRTLQQYINTISLTYPAISPIPTTGLFGTQTTQSIQQYQELFGFPKTGIVDRTLWNSIINTYKDVVSAVTAKPRQYPGFILKTGTEDNTDLAPSGQSVRSLQSFLRVISYHYIDIPLVIPDGNFGTQTRTAVLAFQKSFSLPATGEVDYVVWIKIIEIYDYIGEYEKKPAGVTLFPLKYETINPGEKNMHLYAIQGVLKGLSQQFLNMDDLSVTGIHDVPSVNAVMKVQKISGLNPCGVIDRPTWDNVAALYAIFVSENKLA